MSSESGVWILVKIEDNGPPCWFNTLTRAMIQCDPNTLAASDRIAIIVPYRDLHKDQKRHEQLKAFVPTISKFLQKGGVPFKIYIVEQSNDGRKFNRGKLLNVGFTLAVEDQCTVFIFHDVDLIPSDDLLPFYTTRPTDQPIHIAKLWGRYTKDPRYPYFGGIASFSKQLYERLNGYPNNYWGWGGEDDELRNRIATTGMTISTEPTRGTIFDMEQKELHEKIAELRAQPNIKCYEKKELLKEHVETWQRNGLSNFRQSEQFKVLRTECLTPHAIKISVELSYNGHPFTDQKCIEI